VDHAAAVAMFKGCQFFVLPSRHEPMGIVNLEAMAAGKAVVATRVGGVPELVEDGATGLLVSPDDVQGLGSAIQRLVSDDELRSRLGFAGQRRAAQFNWTHISECYVNVYRTSLGSSLSARANIEATPQSHGVLA
jgi:glycosyltransferase involved in cell wall biosynthesis